MNFGDCNPIERVELSAQELAAAFSDLGDFARSYSDGLRTIFDQWGRQVLAAIIRDLPHPRYHRLRRQHIAKARGKNWRSIR